jgi:hypothetical protein
MKLYSVTTTVKEYSGCKNVVFNWLRRVMPPGKRPYADLIKDYEPESPDALYAEARIEELFTWDEARQLKDYLERYHGDEGETVIKQVPLPVENRTIAYGCLPSGGGNDFYMLWKESEYSLPFEIWGNFRLEGCTLIDNGDTYRHRLMIVSENDDGTIDARMETNPEAAARERRRDAIARDSDDSDCPF